MQSCLGKVREESDRRGSEAMSAPNVKDIDRCFAVVVHDVAPAFLPQLAKIAEALAPRVGRKVAGAVVPCWHGCPIDCAETGFERFVAETCGEVLQHGYTHRQERPGLLSLLTGCSDELAGLPREDVRRRLGLGRELLRQVLDVAPAGFVPPAWQVGRATVEELRGCGFRYLATFGAIRGANGPAIPLSTWSWDWGVLGLLGRVGQRFGDALWWLRPQTLPCVVVHPVDVDRGYLPRVLEVIDRLLGMRRTPGLLSEFLP